MNCVRRAGRLPRAPPSPFRRCLSQSSSTCQEAPVRNETRSNNRDEKDKKIIHITGLPRSATPADVMRMVRQSVKDDGLVKNISGAQLDYNRFIPTGRAFLSVTTGFYARPIVKHLQNSSAQLSSLPIRAYNVDISQVTRRRGTNGKHQAAERGVLDGCGMGGGINAKGCDVVLFGLPGTIAGPALRLYLRRAGFVRMAKNGEPDCRVVKIDIPRKGFSAVSKHLIRLNSPEEAHALVRKLHMTFFLPEVWQRKYLIRARVIH